MAHLAERSLPKPEVRGSNLYYPYLDHLFTVNCIEETKMKEKEVVNGSLKRDSGRSLGSSRGNCRIGPMVQEANKVSVNALTFYEHNCIPLGPKYTSCCSPFFYYLKISIG